MNKGLCKIPLIHLIIWKSHNFGKKIVDKCGSDYTTGDKIHDTLPLNSNPEIWKIFYSIYINYIQGSNPWVCLFSWIFFQNYSERQILLILCLVVFHALTLKLPIQTSLSVAPKLQLCVRSGEKCQNFRKTSTLLGRNTLPLNSNPEIWKIFYTIYIY